ERLVRARRVDQQHVFHAAALELAKLFDDLVWRANQRGILGRQIRISEALGILIALRAWTARERADGRERLAALGKSVPPLLLVAHDLHSARHADPHAVEALPLPLDLSAIDPHTLDGELDGRDLIKQKVVALLAGATNSFRTSRPHPERRMRLLHRP